MKFSDLYIPALREAMIATFEGRRVNQLKVTSDIGQAIGYALLEDEYARILSGQPRKPTTKGRKRR